jgi:hypothetical protein
MVKKGDQITSTLNTTLSLICQGNWSQMKFKK